jgi:hypothetical protein
MSTNTLAMNLAARAGLLRGLMSLLEHTHEEQSSFDFGALGLSCPDRSRMSPISLVTNFTTRRHPSEDRFCRRGQAPLR